jgi:hypothetical protein
LRGTDGVSRALLANTLAAAIGLLQRCTEAVLGFFDLTKQLGKRTKTSPVGLACPQFVENALPPAIQCAELFAPGQELLINDFGGALEHLSWMSLGKAAV